MILLIWQYRQSGGVPVRISRSCTPARTSRSFTHARISCSCTHDRVSRSCTPVRISRPCTLARISCSCTHARISRALAHPPGYPTLAHTPGYMAFVPAYVPPLEHTPVFLDPHDPLNQHGLLSIIYYDTVNLTIPPIWWGTQQTYSQRYFLESYLRFKWLPSSLNLGRERGTALFKAPSSYADGNEEGALRHSTSRGSCFWWGASVQAAERLQGDILGSTQLTEVTYASVTAPLGSWHTAIRVVNQFESI